MTQESRGLIQKNEIMLKLCKLLYDMTDDDKYCFTYAVEDEGENDDSLDKTDVRVNISKEDPEVLKMGIDYNDIFDQLTILNDAYHLIEFKDDENPEDLDIIIKNTSYLWDFLCNLEDIIENEKSIKESNKGIYEYQRLFINENSATLKYGNAPTINIPLDNDGIQFLIYLIKKPETVRKYEDIAKEIGIVMPSDTNSKKDFERQIQFKKRDLWKILEANKLDASAIEELKKMIVNQRNSGYILKSP